MLKPPHFKCCLQLKTGAGVVHAQTKVERNFNKLCWVPLCLPYLVNIIVISDDSSFLEQVLYLHPSRHLGRGQSFFLALGT